MRSPNRRSPRQEYGSQDAPRRHTSVLPKVVIGGALLALAAVGANVLLSTEHRSGSQVGTAVEDEKVSSVAQQANDTREPQAQTTADPPDLSTAWDFSETDRGPAIFVDSERPIENDAGGTNGDFGSLWIGCFDGTTILVLEFGEYRMSDEIGYNLVSFYIDGGDVIHEQAVQTGSQTTLSLPAGASSISFVERLFGHQTFEARAMPYWSEAERPVSMSFPIAGVAQEIGPIRAACGW